jgi:hypothetical protein
MGAGRSDTRIFSRCCGVVWGDVGVLIQSTPHVHPPAVSQTQSRVAGLASWVFRVLAEFSKSAGHNCARSDDQLDFCSAVHGSETFSFHRE